MIEALILVHLWSLVVAGCAWALQRDGGGRIGARFPAPNIWLTLIALCFVPGALFLMPLGNAISLPEIEIFELIPAQVGESSAVNPRPFNYLLAYIFSSLLLIIHTLWRWSRLQRLPLNPTIEPGVYTTTSDIPPLTLSWPRRAVVIPRGFEDQAALIRHERAHLRQYDSELTLLLLILRDAMLRSPGVSYLVRQWRLAIELRADYAATNMLAASQRKDYAKLLLSFQQPNEVSGGTLPCPTAGLSSKRHRNVKMRLTEIMENEPVERKRHWNTALLLTFIAASGIGLMSAAATASSGKGNAHDYVIVDYIKKTPLQLPASCPGLESNLKARGINFEEVDIQVGDQLFTRHKMTLGTVVVGHDVRRDGSNYNSRVLSSTHPCFEAEAKAAIASSLTQPQESEIKNVAAKLHFSISAETPEELNDKLRSYLR
ncbi:MAG: M56 family metallopeptidase [Pseudomonadota bacterium]